MRTLLSAAIIMSSPIIAIAQNPGDVFFYDANIHSVYLTFTQAGYWDSLTKNKTLDVYMVGSVEMDGNTVDSVGVKLKGNSSYNSYPGAKKSMKLAFNEYRTDQRYDGLKTINLNNAFKDPTMLREKIMLDFCNSHGIPAPRCTYAKLYINGTYWGLYSAVEQVDKVFLETRFGNGNNDGNLFKGDPQGDLKWWGSTVSSYYGKYELKTNETANDWADLVYLIDKVNNTPDTQLYDTLENILDANYFIKVWASNNLFVNLDSYIGSGHNYYVYHDEQTGRFNTITWDVNEAFGNFNQGMSVSQIENLSVLYLSNPSNNRPVCYRMLQNSTYKAAYINQLCEWVQYDFSAEALGPVIDSLANWIRTDYYADPNKMYTNQQFEDNINSTINVTGPGGNQIPGLKSFIANRRSAVAAELAGLGCTVGISDAKEESNVESVVVFPNPVQAEVAIRLTLTQDRQLSVKLFDIFGKEIKNTGSLQLTGGTHTLSMDVQDLADGIYFLKLGNDNMLITQKIQVIH